MDAASPRPAYLSLNRLVGALSGVAFLVVLLFSVEISTAKLQQLRQGAAQTTQQAATFLADHASRLFELAGVAMTTTADRIGERNWDDVAQDQALQQRMRDISRTLPYIEDIWLDDDRGQLRLSSRAFPAPPFDSSGRLTFRLIQAAGNAMVAGDLIVGRITHRTTFSIGQRLSWPDGRLRGMVSATADIAYFSDYWSRLDLPFGAAIRLVRRDGGQVLVGYPAGEAASDGPATIRPVRDLPLDIAVSYSEPAVLRAWCSWVRTYAALPLSALVALSLLSVLAFRQARRDVAAAAALEAARNQLVEANAGLEATVGRRTAELQAANEEIQSFAVLISHDLRAPLVNIVGFTNEIEGLVRDVLALRHGPPDEPRLAELETDLAEAIGFVRGGAHKMQRLISHILAVARAGGRPLKFEPVEMAPLLRGLADAIRFQTDAAGAVFVIGAMPAVTSDRMALEQVFGNLMDNAIKYLQPGRPGRVSISGTAIGSRAVFEVSDNGRGIVPENLGRVFKLFQRAASDQPGDGVGLAYVRTLVRKLGGQITLSSEPGIGSTFTIDLPGVCEPMETAPSRERVLVSEEA